jgi:hypothetical protein
MVYYKNWLPEQIILDLATANFARLNVILGINQTYYSNEGTTGTIFTPCHTLSALCYYCNYQGLRDELLLL